ncbi:hypothetical protein [Fodinibius sediminis]|uniref:Uncharacterized protein n=1 Tax=Fodinibius sediminis TaxID=1214077 RepID=A0A521D4Y6_9BACT|nr:hypothetical protein [Fodinibius sediminis]SMO66739.1 hypothetical protein SAMN06265218_108150 [Fodinibius sediminis]
MDRQLRNKVITEVIWLAGLLFISAIIEYVFILLLDLHPILSVKIQVVIGLTIIGYAIRMAARLVSYFKTSTD